MAQTRTVAPASGMPRELKTISSLREPWAWAGGTTPGAICSTNTRSAQRNVIVLTRSTRDAVFDRIISLPLQSDLWYRRRDYKELCSGLAPALHGRGRGSGNRLFSRKLPIA